MVSPGQEADRKNHRNRRRGSLMTGRICELQGITGNSVFSFPFVGCIGGKVRLYESCTSLPKPCSSNCLLFLRGDRDFGVGCEVRAFHPDDLALPFDNRPLRPRDACDFQAFEDFLDLARTAGIAEGDAIAGTPIADGGGRGRITFLSGISGVGAESPCEPPPLTGNGDTFCDSSA